MRSESQASAVSRSRAVLARVRRWLGGQGRTGRAIVGLVALVAIGTLVYFSLPNQEEPSWLYAGRKFSQEDAQAIQAVLAAEEIPVFSDREGRIGVRPSSWSKALTALNKKKAVPPSLEEIEKDYQTPSLWESRDQREQRLQWGLEHKLEVMIERLGDILSADVTVHREQLRNGLRPEWKLSAFVYVDAGAAREIGPRSVRAIQTLLLSNCAGLKPDAISISDRSGKFYLVAGDPNAGQHSRTMARAEELREGLVERLSYIKGLDVLVQMEEPSSEVPPPVAIPVPAKSAEKVVPPATMIVNQPIELDPDAPAPLVEPVKHEPKEATPLVVSSPKAKVWIQVPRSYYLSAFDENFPGRPPSPEELVPYIARTENLIRNAVSVLIPTQELATLKLDTIPDAPIQPRFVATGAPTGENWLNGYPAWVPGAAVGAGSGLLIVTVTGFGLMASRRPRLPARTALRRGSLAVDPAESSIPGPSERVRELVRANPEAAAGVLHRWIGQEQGGSRK